ncbi:branched-chain amino acid aminotransferase [Siminovitchia terrae]|uniref:Branched-chain-amino-acid aminotransferase n=1 Tax=Siminovitchia terrae TaxID=1914933 RepID=A0A429X1Z9_SIMTE|nr:branched-chain amino acid aminotransferase [Siminovitchia terrae]RST57160.1 branched-chain amino acid aminotransferase [Siminovitchia terrae]GIN93926.1 branched-chain-amino-acid aminotransferase 2 [Siminovitchia terrae]
MNRQIDIQLSTNRKDKPSLSDLKFGKTYTDHMFIMDYSEEKGWHDPRIVPYQPITLDPAATIFHYGQTIFEGLKAYISENEEVFLFRPDENIKRLNRSSTRMCIPEVDEELALEALQKLVSIDRDWIPNQEGMSLYIRPFIISTEPNLDVTPSKSYTFMIIMSPVGSFYKEGMNPVKISVESEFVRAVRGGTGNAKTAGNYAGAMIVQEKASASGYSQVLWLDGKENKYIEEVGSMNVFFKINGEVVTPALSGSILEGITRKSVIELLQHWGVPVSERRISIEELHDAYQNGQLEEAFGSGTAAVISPIGELFWKNEKMIINNGKTGELSLKVYNSLTGIQTGKEEDPFGWRVKVE